MRIGLTSDTHGSREAIRKVLEKAPEVDMWLHAGDFGSDADLLAKESKNEVIRCRGNCDASHDARLALTDVFLEKEGFKIWLTHGNRYLDFGGTELLASQGAMRAEDIVVFGHTHVPFFEKIGGVWLINPGSPARPKTDKGATFAVLDLKEGQDPEVEFIGI